MWFEELEKIMETSAEVAFSWLHDAITQKIIQSENIETQKSDNKEPYRIKPLALFSV
jgi:hypothetical protein